MKNTRFLALGAATLFLLGACSQGTSVGGSTASASADGAKAITYSLWDPHQLPAYQKCADAFSAESGVKVTIKQQGWDDYWTSLTTDFVSGTAPDVITNHVAYYPELAANKQLLDLTPYIEKDKVDLSMYTGDLKALWKKDDKQYGIPQDWDTIALVYNTTMLEAAGMKADDLKALTWNPTDGGTFGELIQKLTVDANGKHGNEAGFDKTKVTTYGWGLEKGGGVVGQTQWSWMALSNGFTYLDKNPFGTKYQLDDPKLSAALSWWQKQIEAGYVMPLEQAGQLGLEPMMEQGKAALITDGSWRIGTWASSKAQKFAFAPLPKGPEGQKTIINGLAPSITATSKNPDAAWSWVKFLTSDKCQSIIASEAVVFPSIPAQSQAAAKVHKDKGIDVSAFLDITKDKSSLAYYPITDKANEINAAAQAVIDDIEQGKADPTKALPELNTSINALLK